MDPQAVRERGLGWTGWAVDDVKKTDFLGSLPACRLGIRYIFYPERACRGSDLVTHLKEARIWR